MGRCVCQKLILPSPPVVVHNLHVETFGSLGDLVPDLAHSDDAKGGVCHFNSHEPLRNKNRLWVDGNLMT